MLNVVYNDFYIMGFGCQNMLLLAGNIFYKMIERHI